MGGKTDTVKGRLKEATGVLTDNDALQREGKVDQKIGKVKKVAAEVAEARKEKLDKVLEATRKP